MQLDVEVSPLSHYKWDPYASKSTPERSGVHFIPTTAHILNQYRLLPVGIDHMHCVANAACIQPALHVHLRYTAGACQFRLGHDKGRWAHFNVKLHFSYLFPSLFPPFLFQDNTYTESFYNKIFWDTCIDLNDRSTWFITELECYDLSLPLRKECFPRVNTNHFILLKRIEQVPIITSWSIFIFFFWGSHLHALQVRY